MRRHPIYFALGVLMILGAFAADLRGWTLSGVTERRGGAPRSVRENPGAYRSVYRSSARFRHGK
jgi:hypothetical protein